jgi:hypothetical protein
MKFKWFFYFLLLISLGACNPPQKQRLEHEFTQGVWNKFSNMQWDITFPEGKTIYELSLELQIGEKFKEETIRVQLIVEGEDGESRNQGISYPISAFKEQSMEGEQRKQLVKSLPTAGNFKAGTTYHIELASLMPHLDTPGIYKLSLVFTPIDG